MSFVVGSSEPNEASGSNTRHGDSAANVGAEHSHDANERDFTSIVSPSLDDSPLHRAGLLQPRSYVSSGSSRASMPLRTQGDIRSSTVQLSNVLLSIPGQPRGPPFSQEQSRSVAEHDDEASASSRNAFIFPTVNNVEAQRATESPHFPPLAISFTPSSQFSRGSPRFSPEGSGLSESTSTLASTLLNTSTPRLDASQSGTMTPRGTHSASIAPSGLSILLARQSAPSESEDGGKTPTGPISRSLERPRQSPSPLAAQASQSVADVSQDDHRLGAVVGQSSPLQNGHYVPPSALAASSNTASESTPLLGYSAVVPNGNSNGLNGHSSHIPSPKFVGKHSSFSRFVSHVPLLSRFGERVRGLHVKQVAKTAFGSLPAVLLGTLLNILDGVSYGMIIFPSAGIFADLGGMGVSMFFVSTVVAQLVYTLGGSAFAGANGSMMIEVVPFFHILASTIARDVGEDNVREVIATTLAAYALSSILTGLSFFLLGALRLGALIGFFPRHILVGCIGGVGVFLILTGLTVTTQLPSDALEPSLETLRFLFLNLHSLAQWLPPFALAVLLRVITARWKHQLVFPVYFLIIPTVFYIVVLAGKFDLGALRDAGWLFESANGTGGDEDKWYGFYTYYDLRMIHWTPIWATLPTQFALLFFNILHPPLNVPALSVSLDEDIDTDRELVGHGYSNLLAGFLGTVPNYLVYVNTLLFYRVGGGTRISGLLLAAATFVLLLIGTGPIAFIPVMVVGALIFVLGIDLVKEALWDTRHRVSRMEYITIVSIMVCMTVWDFVVGVLFGIVVSCFFFVVQNSQRRSIRACYTGDTAMSTVRRPTAHRAYIREVSKQTRILRLQGFLFFGTIAHVEDTLRSIVDDAVWQRHPVRFVVVDLSLVAGVDLSSAEAFVRVQRLLAAKGVVLVFCGVQMESAVGKALSSVGVLGEDYVEVFGTFNDAMEWTENAYLRAWFRAQKTETSAVVLPGRQDLRLQFDHSLTGSPRRQHLRDAGDRTIAHEFLSAEIHSEPYNTLVKAFASYDDIDRDDLRALVPYFERTSAPEGLVLWEHNDNPDGLYIIEAGVLRASYRFAEHTPVIEESMVPGTLAGELSALSGLPRNARVVVERQAVLWKMSGENMRRLKGEEPRLAQTFIQLVLKAAKNDNDVLLSAVATRQ